MWVSNRSRGSARKAGAWCCVQLGSINRALRLALVTLLWRPSSGPLQRRARARSDFRRSGSDHGVIRPAVWPRRTWRLDPSCSPPWWRWRSGRCVFSAERRDSGSSRGPADLSLTARSLLIAARSSNSRSKHHLLRAFQTSEWKFGILLYALLTARLLKSRTDFRACNSGRRLLISQPFSKLNFLNCALFPIS